MELYDKPEVRLNLFWDYLETAKAFHIVSRFIEQNGYLHMKQTKALWATILKAEFDNVKRSHFALAQQYSPIQPLTDLEDIVKDENNPI